MPSRSQSAASSVAVMRCAFASRCARTIDLARKALRRLRAPQSLALDRPHDASVVVDLLERVDDRQRRDRAAVPPRTAAMTRSIVSSPTSGRAASWIEHDRSLRRADRRARSRPTRCACVRRRDHQAIDVALEDPRRRIARRNRAAARTTTDTTSGRAMNVCRLCSSAGFPATQRNCFSSRRPPRAGARPAAAGDDARRPRRARRSRCRLM